MSADLVTKLMNTIGMAPSLPKTYKVAVFESKGTPLVFKDFDLKLPENGEVCSPGSKNFFEMLLLDAHQ